jgi:hypothetical protein
VLCEESLDSWSDVLVTELWHAWEQVMLDLPVEISHPPVAPHSWGDVDSMVGGGGDPVDMLVSWKNWLVSVVDGEVSEEIHGLDGMNQEVSDKHPSPRHVNSDNKSQDVVNKHCGNLVILLNFEHISWVVEEAPEENGQDSSRKEGECLPLQNALVSFLGDLFVEGNQWKSLKIDIMLHLLWGSVMAVVHVSPVSR